MAALVGKRKKKRPKACVNPLFERWLQEWRDEAAEKGWKTQYIFSKALKSLRHFPLALATGKDCKILQNFGDKICKMLDDKLAKHVATHGTDTMTPSDDEEDLIVPLTMPANQKPYKKQPVQSATVTHTTAAQHGPMGSISLDSDDEVAAPQRKRRKSSGNKGPREYIPALRSGAYAILLALYRYMQDPDTRGFMTKSEIIRAAQPMADKSFSVPDPGCRYTSWSSMGTLIKKGLVIKESSPAKYSLSDAGSELAHRLEAVETGAVPNIPKEPARVPPLHNANPPRLPVLHTMSDSDDDAPNLNPPHRPVVHSMSDSEGETTPVFEPKGLPQLPTLQYTSKESSCSLDKFEFWYITEDCRLVNKKDEAAVLVDDVLVIGFLIKCNYQSLIKSGKRYKLDTSKRLGDDFVYAYLSDLDSPEFANPPQETVQDTKSGKTKASKPKQTASKAKKKSSAVTAPNSDSLQSRLLGNITVQRPTSSIPETSTSNLPHMEVSSTIATSSLKNRLKATSSCSTGMFPRAEKPFLPLMLDEDSLPDVAPCPSVASSCASSIASTLSSRDLPVPNFTLKPGTFDIVLCVDNCEFYGRDSKTLLPDLLKNGVECDLRKLHIGDMLWIAREKVDPQPGQLEKPKGRELVIDFIVERKRMDDLVASMTDGRFREQKFRLKRSGVANAIYLVEDHGSLEHYSLPEDRIKQAIVNTQVIDGFNIKRTSGVKETVAYLTVMTRYLQSFYRNKTLQACTLEMLRELDASFHIEESEKLLTTFQHFNHASVKNKDLTVRELFGKQLIQLHGISADKAKAITDRYPTPTSLFSVYDNCATQKEREGLLADIKSGKANRSLGSNQSKQVCQLYCTDSALT